MRKLASIREISEIKELPYADKVCHYKVDGWWVIDTKGSYQVGDKCIYCEIDSILPEKPQYEFLRNKKFHIKTMKLKFGHPEWEGALSQGIIFPLSFLPNNYKGKYELCEDVTDLLEITKYEPPEPKQSQHQDQRSKFHKFMLRFKWYKKYYGNRKQRLGFPEWISQTDEERIENMPHLLKDKETKYTVTRKLDGSSITFAIRKYKNWYQKEKFEFIVCSRQVRKFPRDKRFVKYGDKPEQWFYCVDKYQIDKNIKKYFSIPLTSETKFVPDAWYIQGELVGPGIQKNKYNLKEWDVYIFNLVAVNTKTGEKYKFDYDSQYTVNLLLGLKQVPLVQREYILPDTVEKLQKFVHGPAQLNPNTLEEGFVFRNYEKGISFKCVDPDFLLKWKE